MPNVSDHNQLPKSFSKENLKELKTILNVLIEVVEFLAKAR